MKIIRTAIVALPALVCLLGMAQQQPARAQAAADAAEIAFWNSVKDTRNPAEIRAYLDKFPSGMFAALARIRVQELEKAPPTPSPSTFKPTPSSASAAVTDSGSIREVQTRLYNLNYKISSMNGQINNETLQAIRDWQSNVGEAATGTITAGQLTRLRAARIPSTWGAIAYSVRGATGVVWGRGTRGDAERDAMQECRKRGGGSGCKTLTAAEKSCGALGFYTARSGRSQLYGAYGVIRPTLAQATSTALDECRANARRPEACGVRMTFCADGSHRS